MGTFNSIMIPWIDHGSNASVEIEVQFRYGDVWQYRYGIGDQIHRGGNDVGDPSETVAVVPGWPSTLEFAQSGYFEVRIMRFFFIFVDNITLGFGGEAYRNSNFACYYNKANLV